VCIKYIDGYGLILVMVGPIKEHGRDNILKESILIMIIRKYLMLILLKKRVVNIIVV
jgi:hypothetical protein